MTKAIFQPLTTYVEYPVEWFVKNPYSHQTKNFRSLRNFGSLLSAI